MNLTIQKKRARNSGISHCHSLSQRRRVPGPTGTCAVSTEIRLKLGGAALGRQVASVSREAPPGLTALLLVTGLKSLSFQKEACLPLVIPRNEISVRQNEPPATAPEGACTGRVCFNPPAKPREGYKDL